MTSIQTRVTDIKYDIVRKFEIKDHRASDLFSVSVTVQHDRVILDGGTQWARGAILREMTHAGMIEQTFSGAILAP